MESKKVIKLYRKIIGPKPLICNIKKKSLFNILLKGKATKEYAQNTD